MKFSDFFIELIIPLACRIFIPDQRHLSKHAFIHDYYSITIISNLLYVRVTPMCIFQFFFFFIVSRIGEA